MSGARRIVLLAAGTAVGVAIAVAGDVRQIRRAARETTEALAAAPRGPEDQQLARDISRFRRRRRELDRRVEIVRTLRDPGALRSPTPAIDHTLDWADQHGLEVNDLLLEEGALRVLVATADPRAAIALAHDLVGHRLIASPEIRWTRPSAGNGPRWLAVSGRMVLPRRERAPGRDQAAGAR